jgi:hypothetical protein
LKSLGHWPRYKIDDKERWEGWKEMTGKWRSRERKPSFRKK